MCISGELDEQQLYEGYQNDYYQRDLLSYHSDVKYFSVSVYNVWTINIGNVAFPCLGNELFSAI